MRRRTLLTSATAGLAASVAGCTGLFETQGLNAPPVLEDRPDGVYFPTHVEGMQMAGMREAGDFRIAVTYSYAHRFWNVDGTETEMTAIESDDDVHLMVSVWDPETNHVVPDTGVSVTIAKGDGSGPREVVYPMLSQKMGFHYGDNFGLDGAGDYTVSVNVGALPDAVRLTGSFEGRFREQASVDVEFGFDRAHLEEVMYERTPEKAGTAAASRPMKMETMPNGTAVPKSELPGRLLGDRESDDAVLATTLVEGANRFGAGEDEAYLLVSARTPYNRMVVPAAALSATVGGESVTLHRTLDPDVGYHYGAVVPAPASGDAVTVTTDTPPQVARHEGYEMAFRQMDDVSYTV